MYLQEKIAKNVILEKVYQHSPLWGPGYSNQGICGGDVVSFERSSHRAG